MTNIQIKGIIRQLLTMFGAYFVTAGYIDDAGLTQLAGGIAVVFSVGWTVYRNRKRGILKAAADLPEVVNIEVTERHLANTTASDKVNSE